MTRITLALALTVAVTTPTAPDQNGHGHGPKADKHEHAAASGGRVAVNVHFSTGDQRVIREYYAPQYRSLPPGLQKKVARGGELPPGWKKKMQPFPADLDRRLEPLPRGYNRGVIDGHAVIYDTRSHVVLDVAVLF
jgi:hypothetical protein